MNVNSKNTAGTFKLDFNGVGVSLSLADSNTLYDDPAVDAADFNLAWTDTTAGADTTLVKLPIASGSSLRVLGPGLSVDTVSGKSSFRLGGVSFATEITLADETRRSVSVGVHVNERFLMGATSPLTAALLSAAPGLSMPSSATAALYGVTQMLPAVGALAATGAVVALTSSRPPGGVVAFAATMWGYTALFARQQAANVKRWWSSVFG